MLSATLPLYHSCVIGGGLLARLWAHLLSQEGHRVLVIQKLQHKSFTPPYLALTASSARILRQWGFEISGSPIMEMSLHAAPTQLLRHWHGAHGRPLGWHVPAKLLDNLIPQASFVYEAEVIHIERQNDHWEINTTQGAIQSLFCWDFSGIASPLRIALQREWAFIQLDAFQARIGRGSFPEIHPHGASQIQGEHSLWAFLPLPGGQHYVVQTLDPRKPQALVEPCPIGRSWEMMATTSPRPIAAVSAPYERFGALLGHSAYLGHPNVAATFNMGLGQLAQLESFLMHRKLEVLGWEEMNMDFSRKSWWLRQMSEKMGTDCRYGVHLVPDLLMRSLIEQFP